MKTFACLSFGLLRLVSGGAEHAIERETNDGRARTLKGSKSSPSSVSPVSYKPSLTSVAADGGKGMMMQGKGGGMGMLMTMNAPTSSKSKKARSSKSKISAPTTPTARPSVSASTASVTLNAYQIGYVVTLTYIPSVEEVDGVVNVTKQYLSSTFDFLFPSMTVFETNKIADRLMLNAPYEIEYRSTIRVRLEVGSALPSLDELNSELQTAFTLSKGAYLTLLMGELDQDNLFNHDGRSLRIFELVHVPQMASLSTLSYGFLLRLAAFDVLLRQGAKDLNTAVLVPL